MLSYAPILWIFLSSLFFFKLACSLFRNCIILYVLFLYVQVVLCCTVHRVIIRRYDFSLLVVDFYFTLFITTKHNNNNGMRHETVWLDRTIHCDSIKNREDGKRSNSSSSYDWKVPHQAHFLPPFCFASLLLILLLFYYSDEYRTINDQIDTMVQEESSRVVR